MRTHNLATLALAISTAFSAPVLAQDTETTEKKNNLRLNKSQLQPKNAPSQFKKYLFPLLP